MEILEIDVRTDSKVKSLGSYQKTIKMHLKDQNQVHPAGTEHTPYTVPLVHQLYCHLSSYLL